MVDEKKEDGLGHILAEILEYGGIQSKETPVLNVYCEVDGKVQRQSLTTLEAFCKSLESRPARYQLSLEKPTITYLDPNEFDTDFLDIACTLLPDGTMKDTTVHTGEEDIYPDQTKEFKKLAKARGKKMGEKVEGSLKIIMLFAELVNVINKMIEQKHPLR
ncbi:MAG: hypothetical protein M1503_02355 [Thaumarchaeota archaeon]|nr:hypothetical protein [Nitrososphaerota archaeon]MCL5317094.1 hypothetical protein [Nitrososphaerota archaeon]